MYIISKEFHCSASHELRHLPKGHPCYRNHGHNYVFTFEFSSDKLDKDHFVIDYRELAQIKRWIDIAIDHRLLNDVFPSIEPTSENLAKVLYNIWKNKFPMLSAVSVQETPKTLARYVPQYDTSSNVIGGDDA